MIDDPEYLERIQGIRARCLDELNQLDEGEPVRLAIDLLGTMLVTCTANDQLTLKATRFAINQLQDCVKHYLKERKVHNGN